MWTLKINGKDQIIKHDGLLIDYLRNELALTSVKNGCKEGACGTCTVLVDGKATRACIQKISRLDGKSIQTVEGLSDYEKAVYGYAFAKAGAVQCGFCIPGMVIAAKGLISQNSAPTRADVKTAIRGNICRCTGYQKIEDAVLLAASLLSSHAEVPSHVASINVGKEVFRVDAKVKTLGEAKYADDYSFPDMLHARNVFTKHAHARINSINVDEAKTISGVVAVYTAEDIPGNRYIGHLAKDWPGMIAVGEETKFIGDTLAMVVATTREAATAGIEAVKVDYTVLPVINNPSEAMAKDAHQIHGEGFMQFGKFRIPENNRFGHEEVKRGDVEAKFAKSQYIAEATFELPPTEHAFMEPETAVAFPEDEGICVITGGQGIYDEVHEISEYLGIPQEKVHIKSAVVGGGFGGKEDMSVQHQAALCAYLSGKPVKVSFTRQESINYHPKRHAMTIWAKIGCDKDGIFQAMQARLISDTGAYASLGGPVLQRACTHAGGPYNYQDVDIEGDCYYTNNPPGGAFRGFGVTQSAVAIECLINDLAHQTGLDGWEIRYRNAIRPGQSLPNGQIADAGTAMAETLLEVKDIFYRYEKDPSYVVGIASAMKNAGIGVGIPDPGRCDLYVSDGKIEIRSSAGAIGQGVQTVLLQIVGETTGVPRHQLVVAHPDSKSTPDAGTTTASRQTVFTGEAARLAATKLKADLSSGKTLADLEGKLYNGVFDYKTDPIGSDKPNPVSHIAYGYATQLFVLEQATGKLVEVHAAHDVGKAINRTGVEGQIEGGVAMAIGYGLTEDFPLKDGVPMAKLGTLGLIRANQMPPVHTYIVEKNQSQVAYGAKGVGEIVCTMGAPALQNAYFKLDGEFRTKLPLSNTAYRKK